MNVNLEMFVKNKKSAGTIMAGPDVILKIHAMSLIL